MRTLRTTVLLAAGLTLGCSESPGQMSTPDDAAVGIASSEAATAPEADTDDAEAVSDVGDAAVADEPADAPMVPRDAGRSEDASTDAGAVVVKDAAAVSALDAEVGPDAAVGPDAGAATDLAARLLDKRKSCRVFDEKADPSTYSVVDAFDVCIAECWLAASCGEVRASFCTDTETTFWRCQAAAHPPCRCLQYGGRLQRRCRRTRLRKLPLQRRYNRTVEPLAL
ncbi:MAG: hypothetical protein RL385_4616 [Pseudomonadota bacterium]